MGLTEPLPIPAPNLRDQKLDGETSINWDQNETISPGPSSGVYYDSVCANAVSSVSVSSYAGNGEEGIYDVHAPTIVDSEGEVNDNESIIQMKRAFFGRESGLENLNAQE